MAWFIVDEDVVGPKLRRLVKLLKVKGCEATGMLVMLWRWSLHNVDETGMVLDAEIEDLYCIFPPWVTEVPPEDIVEALIESGWIDHREGKLYVHDWDVWQAPWYKLQSERKRNTERMRIKRAEEKERASEAKLEPAQKEEPAQEEPEGETKESPKQKKRKYAEFVTMTDEEYAKLVAEYGTIFATACIEELDNYKGSKGKRYKSDYRAILSWVIDRVNQKRPGLMKMSRLAMEPQTKRNPFEEDGDG